MDKTKIVEALEKHDVDLDDFFESAQFLSEVIDELDLSISIESVRSFGDYYIMCTYYSDKLHKAVILDWDVAGSFESNEELADTVLQYEKEARELEESIKI